MAQAIRAVLLAIAIAACLADMRPSSLVTQDIVRADLRLAHDGHRAGDEECAQIAVALLGEPLLLDLAAGRIVLRHEANPRRQVPAVLNSLASVTRALSALAITGPTEGIVSSRGPSSLALFSLRSAVSKRA